MRSDDKIKLYDDGCWTNCFGGRSVAMGEAGKAHYYKNGTKDITEDIEVAASIDSSDSDDSDDSDDSNCKMVTKSIVVGTTPKKYVDS